MMTKEVNAELKRLGWHLFSSNGERWGEYELPDRYMTMFYKVKHLVSGQRLEIRPGVSTRSFQIVYTIIEAGNGYAPPLDFYHVPEKGSLVESITPYYIETLLSPAIEWARSRDIVAPIKKMLDFPTSAKGDGPIRHFTALAMTGDIEKLQYYQSSFAAGDRLGFVPYVDLSYIERAIKVAEEYVNKKQ